MENILNHIQNTVKRLDERAEEQQKKLTALQSFNTELKVICNLVFQITCQADISNLENTLKAMEGLKPVLNNACNTSTYSKELTLTLKVIKELLNIVPASSISTNSDYDLRKYLIAQKSVHLKSLDDKRQVDYWTEFYDSQLQCIN